MKPLGQFIMDDYSSFDFWIRNRFAQLNTELELLYVKQDKLNDPRSCGDDLKTALRVEGLTLIKGLLAEGNTDKGFDSAFTLLGNVGFYMAACRRHLFVGESGETYSVPKEASALALHLGASIGMTPRFSTSHLTTHNHAIDGKYYRFTDFDDEKCFLDFNTLGIFSFKQAADALTQILPIGISHPAVENLLKSCLKALEDVYQHNQSLFEKLDTQRFFYHIRPYYKPHKVGPREYRGANAGDFAGINIVDMLLGLCRGNNDSYSQLLVDKFLYMRPEDQIMLRDCMRRESILDKFLRCSEEQRKQPWYKKHCRLFLDVCDAHGRTAEQHHNQLVRKFIEDPSKALDANSLESITASGPPLPVLINALEKLRDLRLAAPRDDIPSRYKEIFLLRSNL